jgi:hypothetical protein
MPLYDSSLKHFNAVWKIWSWRSAAAPAGLDLFLQLQLSISFL